MSEKFERELQFTHEKLELPKRRTSIERFVEKKENKIDENFIKDDFLYLIRCDQPGLREKGLTSKAWQEEKLSLDKYLRDSKKWKKNSVLKDRFNELLETQGQVGGTPFVSATTQVSIALGFKEHLKSFYIFKVPVEEVVYNYRTPARGVLPEIEYLVPDFVRPEEILEELSATDDPDKLRDAYYKYVPQKPPGISQEEWIKYKEKYK